MQTRPGAKQHTEQDIAPLAALIIIVALLCTAAAHLFGASPQTGSRQAISPQSRQQSMKVRRLILDQSRTAPHHSLVPVSSSAGEAPLVIEHY